MFTNLEEKKRFKMYKAGKHWVVAPIVFFGVLGVIGASPSQAQAAEVEGSPIVQVEHEVSDTSIPETNAVPSEQAIDVNPKSDASSELPTAKETSPSATGDNQIATTNSATEVAQATETPKTGQETISSTDENKVNVPATPVNVATPEQDKAVEEAKKDENVTVTEETEHLGALTEEEVTKKQAEIDAEQKSKAKEIAQKVKELQEKNKKIAEENAKKKAAYEKQLAEHKKTLAEAEKNKGKDGYLSEIAVKNLHFEQETHSKQTILSKHKALTKEQAKAEVLKNTNDQELAKLFHDSTGWGKTFILEQGKDPLIVEYTLSNANYKGTKISKVKYIYTPKKIDTKTGRTIVIADPYPTNTIHYADYHGKVRINMDVTFYDMNGKEVKIKDSLLSFSSLNSTSSSREYVANFNGTYLSINGSSIKVHGKDAYANQSTDFKSEGSKHDMDDWDADDSPLNYYGAIVGRSTDHINFDFGSENRGYIWFAFNTKLKTTAVTPEPPKLDLGKSEKLTIHVKKYDLFQLYTPKPTKEVKDPQKMDINHKNVLQGDNLNYEMKWDLKGYGQRYQVESTDLVHGVSFKDDYDEARLVAQKDLLNVIDAQGNSLLDQVVIEWDDTKGVFTITAIDPLAFIKTHGGTELHVFFATKAKANVTGDIVNTAIQNTFGYELETEPVINHVPKIDPKKDVVITVGDNQSINQSTVSKDSLFNYQLNSSVRPANYGGNTQEWSLVDVLSKKDQATGQNLVLAAKSFVLADGTKIDAGTDISRYFLVKTVLDENGHQVLIFTATNEFLAIMNLAENKATEQGWTAYIQVKRVGYGGVENTFDESYNNETVKSNTVVTHTPDVPKEPNTPKNPEEPKIPEQPQTPEKPTTPTQVVYTPKTLKPATPKQVVLAAELPKTGEENQQTGLLVFIGGLMGLVGLAGIGFNRKRKNHE